MVHTGKHGLHSEIICTQADNCFLIPENMSWEDAAAFPINYLTAYFCLFDIGNLRSNQAVLIPSAAGKVSTSQANSFLNFKLDIFAFLKGVLDGLPHNWPKPLPMLK